MNSNYLPSARVAGFLGTMICAAAFTVGCNQEREALPPEKSAPPTDSKAVKVTVEPVTFRPVQRMVTLVGTLHGYEEITLGAKVGGRIRKISHDVSDRVQSGALLLEIDPTDYQLNVRQAQKSLQVEVAKLGLSELPSPRTDVTKIPVVVQAQLKRDNAQSRLDRTEKLLARKAASDEDFTERSSEVRVAQAEYENQILVAKAGIAAIQVKQESLAIAQQQLQDTLIRVPVPSQPIPGEAKDAAYAISSRAVSEGSYVMEGTELFKLVIEQPLKFRGPVPERKSGEVRLGQKAEVYTSAYPEAFPGQVTRINPAIDPQTRTFEIEILVDNKNGQLKPGGFAKTAILTALDEHAATVPLEALVHFAGVTKIFLVVGGHAKEVPVTLGVQATQWVEIASPALPPDAQVVTSGQTVIADGTPIAVRDNAKSGHSVLTADAEAPQPHSASPTPVARREATP